MNNKRLDIMRRLATQTVYESHFLYETVMATGNYGLIQWCNKYFEHRFKGMFTDIMMLWKEYRSM